MGRKKRRKKRLSAVVGRDVVRQMLHRATQRATTALLDGDAPKYKRLNSLRCQLSACHGNWPRIRAVTWAQVTETYLALMGPPSPEEPHAGGGVERSATDHGAAKTHGAPGRPPVPDGDKTGSA